MTSSSRGEAGDQVVASRAAALPPSLLNRRTFLAGVAGMASLVVSPKRPAVASAPGYGRGYTGGY